MSHKPIVALVGRPNVGKSSLFNRIVGERLAVIHEIPGTTRDRLQATAIWNGITFRVIDTGGIEIYQPKNTRDTAPLAEGSIDFVPQIKAQAMLAIEEADVIIMVVDAMQGITAADETIAETLRRTNKTIVIAANKTDHEGKIPDSVECYGLGLGEVVACSAIHGLGIGDLLDSVTLPMKEIVESIEEDDDENDDKLRIAIVGRPNAGKSTLLNKLTGEERVIVSPIAGTTRDAIDTEIMWHGNPVTLIDTAGIRRRGRIESGVEKFSVVRAMNAIERCHVAILVIDAELGVTEQDEHIAGYVIEEFKSLVIVVNKWDAIEKDSYTMNEFTRTINERLHFVPYAPIIFISALQGQRIHTVLETANRVFENRFTRIPTGEFNRILREAIEHHAPPTKGTKRLKVFYGTQVRTNPPVFLIHVNERGLMHFTYERFLENRIREAFPFEGTPIRISFREREQRERKNKRSQADITHDNDSDNEDDN